MYCKRTSLAAVILATCAACTRQPAKLPTERIAILRFENLGGDRSADWMGRAFSEIITADLASARGIYVIPSSQMHLLDQQMGVRAISAPGISAERPLALLSGASQVAYGDFSVQGGRLRAHLTLEDVATGAVVRLLTAEIGVGDIGGAASQFARQLSASAAAYGTSSSQAIEAYVMAMEDPGPGKAEWASRAIAADPNFAPPYRLLAGFKAGQKDIPGALAVLGDAVRRGDGMAPAERARIAFEAASLRNDQGGRLQALADLVKMTPGDVEAWRSLGELAFSRRDYPQSISAFERLLALEPDDVGALNQIGYAYANAGNLEKGVASLQRYAMLRPGDGNAQDSLGDVHLMFGQLAQATNFYLEAHHKDPNLQGSAGADLFKAAMAKLMAGDVAGADALEKEFDDSRAAAHDPAVPFRQAEWQWLTGRRKEAYQALAAFAQATQNGPLKELSSRAYCGLSVWSVMMGDRSAAGEMAAKAGQLAGPNGVAPAVLVRFLAQPPASVAEWSSRADALFHAPGQESLRDLWLAYALLLNKEFAAAVPIAQRLYDSGSNDESLPVLLAWASVGAGRVDQAAPLLRFNPIPPITGMGLFTSWYFPRIYALRAVVAEKQGRVEEARTARQLFVKLSGPTALVWDNAAR